MTTDNPDPLEVAKAILEAIGAARQSASAQAAAAAIIAQHYAPVIAENERLAALRGLVATLYCASGCSCCRDCDTWNATQEQLGELLGIPKYDDGSGRDWYSVRDAHAAALGAKP